MANSDIAHSRQPSHISRVPLEVLGNILSKSTTTAHGCFYRDKGYVESLVDLAVVCRLWSAVVFNEHSLWTNFHVEYESHTATRDPPGTSGMADRAVATLRRWYSRSGQLPIQIALDVKVCHRQSSDDSSLPLDISPLTKWITSLDRWTGICITLESDTVSLAAATDLWTMLYATPLAQHKTLGRGCFDHVRLLELHNVPFRRANIEQLYLAGTFPACTDFQVKFHTRSNVDGAFPLGDALVAHPGLRRLVVDAPIFRKPGAAMVRLCSLPKDVPVVSCRLQRLFINNVGLLAPGDLGRIECPELSHLQLAAQSHPRLTTERRLASEVRKMIAQSACPLKMLRMHCILLDDDILFEILVLLTTSLEELYINEEFYAEDRAILRGTFYDRLSEYETTHCTSVLPKLRKMSIKTTDNQPDSAVLQWE